MNYKTAKVVEVRDIEKAVEEKFGVNIDVAPTMWPEDYMNDCYKMLYFGSDSITENQEELNDCDEDDNEKELYEHRAMIYSIMKENFPFESRVLVDVSW